jgi:hypothetical protein
MTTYEFMLAILILPTNFKVVAIISTILGTIINLIFLSSTITLVVIMLYSKVSSTYKY